MLIIIWLLAYFLFDFRFEFWAKIISHNFPHPKIVSFIKATKKFSFAQYNKFINRKKLCLPEIFRQHQIPLPKKYICILIFLNKEKIQQNFSKPLLF